MRRENIVEGLYYPDEPKELAALIESSLDRADRRTPRRDAVGLIAPYGSYEAVLDYLTLAYYSASVSAPDLIVIMAPSHGRLTGALAVPESSRLDTPIGGLQVCEEAIRVLVESSEAVCYDETAHLRDFGIEVHLPVVKTIFPDAQLLPLLVGPIGGHAVNHLTRSVLHSIRGRQALVCVSANMSSFGPNHHIGLQAETIKDALLTGNGELVLSRGSRIINPPRGLGALALGHQLNTFAGSIVLLDRGIFTAETEEGYQSVALGAFAYYPATK